jgi:hypothetical protein
MTSSLGFGRRLSWPVLRYFPESRLETETPMTILCGDRQYLRRESTLYFVNPSLHYHNTNLLSDFHIISHADYWRLHMHGLDRGSAERMGTHIIQRYPKKRCLEAGIFSRYSEYLRDGRRGIVVGFPAKARDFYFLGSIQTGSMNRPAAYSVGGGFIPQR